MAKGFTSPEAGKSKPRKAANGAQDLSRSDEQRLLKAARAGDERALREIVQMVSGPAYRFSVGFCRNPDDAEDLVQDVMATLLRTLDSFRGESSLSTWTYIVAKRACGRRKQRAARMMSIEDLSPVDADRADDAPGPAGRVEQRQLGAALEQAISELPDNQKQVLVLRDVEGLSAAEVGEILGLGERAVKSRLHRARLVLREKLAPFVKGGNAPPPAQSCPDTARMLSRYMEGELTPDVCARMEEHVSKCPSCGGTCESLRQVLGACRTHGARPLSPELRTAVRNAVKTALATR
ncbi:MAG: sigma-70 family RNA polymerase sigma factor [Candidatus Eisenbacteria bacterium]